MEDNTNFRCVALTQGAMTPSTRFRWQQYGPALSDIGVDVEELTARFGAYAPAAKSLRPAWLAGACCDALHRTLKTSDADVCFLQRSLIAKFPTFERLIKPPVVLDIDDAIFSGMSRSSFGKLLSAVDSVICGNEFIADHIPSWCEKRIIPTAIDTERFFPVAKEYDSNHDLILGWSGTSWSFKWLYEVEDALRNILLRNQSIKLKIVADKQPNFRNLPAKQVIFQRWSPETEVAQVQSFDIGLMPLPDDLWTRGKCSFKLLMYMAVGIPSVVSPVGMNSSVLSMGELGFGAKNVNEFEDYIQILSDNPKLRHSMGEAGRAVAVANFSVDIVGKLVGTALKAVS